MLCRRAEATWGGGCKMQHEAGNTGWEHRELFSGPWSIVMYNECLIYTHNHSSTIIHRSPINHIIHGSWTHSYCLQVIHIYLYNLLVLFLDARQQLLLLSCFSATSATFSIKTNHFEYTILVPAYFSRSPATLPSFDGLCLAYSALI